MPIPLAYPGRDWAKRNPGRPPAMKLLVLTSDPLDAHRLRAALPQDIDPQQAEVMIVAPALQESPVKFWLSDADDAIARARAVGEETASRLSGEGIRAEADTGAGDPYQAIQDALQTFPADRIILFTRGGEHERYREDVDPREVSERFGVPAQKAPS